MQEVYATKVAADMLMPGTDVIIELGGEDAKILFLQGTEVRMNGSCAGGTGAFIDQMATLLGVTPTEMNEEAKRREKPTPSPRAAAYSPRRTCSRCSIQGAARADVARSIFMAVVNQTIAGLAQGRADRGQRRLPRRPAHLLCELRACFDEALGTSPASARKIRCTSSRSAPAHQPSEPVLLGECLEAIEAFHSTESYNALPPLFRDEDELAAFRARHARAQVKRRGSGGVCRRRVSGHRLRLDDHQIRRHRPRRGAAADPLPEQQRRSRAPCARAF